MATATILEFWMELTDRTLLAELMKEQGLSARALSLDAGWKSHTYLQQLLRGEKTTLKAEPAARIAHRLGVPFRILFVSRASEIPGQTDRQKKVS